MLRTDNTAGPYLSDGDSQEVFGSEYLDTMTSVNNLGLEVSGPG